MLQQPLRRYNGIQSQLISFIGLWWSFVAKPSISWSFCSVTIFPTFLIISSIAGSGSIIEGINIPECDNSVVAKPAFR